MSWTIALAISTTLLAGLSAYLLMVNLDLKDSLRREERRTTRLRADAEDAWDNSRIWQDLYCRAANRLQAVRDALDTPDTPR